MEYNSITAYNASSPQPNMYKEALQAFSRCMQAIISIEHRRLSVYERSEPF